MTLSDTAPYISVRPAGFPADRAAHGDGERTGPPRHLAKEVVK